MNRLRRCLVLVIKGYQKYLSPFLPAACRFYPSCSSYAIEALEKRGLLRGSLLVIKRLGKCHPFHEGGVDPIP